MNDSNQTNVVAKKFYFGYGSNMHPCRLKAKNRAPSAYFIGVSQLIGYVLKFNKKSDDCSGKGNIVKTDSASDCVYGTVYAMTCADKTQLGNEEGGYKEKSITVMCEGKEYSCFTYEAKKQTNDQQPYHWYKDLVVLGAEYAKLPDEYIATIKATPSKPDPCDNRRKKKEKLIAEIKHYTGD